MVCVIAHLFFGLVIVTADELPKEDIELKLKKEVNQMQETAKPYKANVDTTAILLSVSIVVTAVLWLIYGPPRSKSLIFLIFEVGQQKTSKTL